MAKKYKIMCTIVMFFIVVLSVFLTVFTTKTFTVIYDTKGGTIIASKEVKPYSTIEVPTNPVMEGYVFVGWQKDGVDFDFSEKIEGNITLTAVWKSVV